MAPKKRKPTVTRSRDFFFTIEEFDEVTENFLQKLDCQYLIYGYEIGEETGRPHYHGYVYFFNARYWDAVRKRFINEGHAKGDLQIPEFPDKVVDYAIKSGNYFEKGVRPASSFAKGESERKRWSDARSAALEGRFDDIPADIYIRHQNSLKRIHREDRPAPSDLAPRATYGVWIYGPTHTGKSHYARTHYQGVYLKDKNKWWDDYKGEENVIIDEVEPSEAPYLAGFIKKWADRWTFRAEYKGGSAVIRPNNIIVTSNFSIDDVFAGRPDIEAIKRRFEIIHLTTVYQL